MMQQTTYKRIIIKFYNLLLLLNLCLFVVNNLPIKTYAASDKITITAQVQDDVQDSERTIRYIVYDDDHYVHEGALTEDHYYSDTFNANGSGKYSAYIYADLADPEESDLDSFSEQYTLNRPPYNFTFLFGQSSYIDKERDKFIKSTTNNVVTGSKKQSSKAVPENDSRTNEKNSQTKKGKNIFHYISFIKYLIFPAVVVFVIILWKKIKNWRNR